ncbi:MAG: sulfatase [Actinomycetota bacterium]
MRTATLAVALLMAACSSSAEGPGQATPEPPSRPNVLVIVTDDQRAHGTMRAMPDTRRFFKQQGKRFTQAFATTPLCCPSRASIFSGRYAHGHGVRVNDLATALDQDRTLQAYLQEAGYRTAVTGKYLNRWPREVDPPHFDDFAIMLQGYYFDALFNVDGRKRRVDGYTNNFVKKSAVGFLEGFERDDAQPWFLYIGATPAHAPYTAEPKYEGAETYPVKWNPAVKEEDLSDKPDFGPGKRSNYQKIRRKQIRTLFSADDLVARVMREVRALGEDRDTIAFFLGDNGQLWGEHGKTAKRYPYLQSVQIPFFMRWPGQVEAGTRDDRLAANIDVAATVLDVTGLAALHEVDGRSLLSDERREELLLEHWADDESEVPTWASLLTETYQYVEYYRRNGDNFVSEYYDLVEDPWQLRNLLGDQSKRNDPNVRPLSARLSELRNCSGPSCP